MKNCKQTEMEKKFDQLLNKKCSWSYRSQKVISQSDDKNSKDSTLQLQSTVMTIQVQDKYDGFNDISSGKNPSVMENDSWLENNSYRIDANKTPVSESLKNKSNKLHACQKKGAVKKTSKKKANIEITKNNSMKATILNSNAKLQNLVECTENMSSTSSENEVLQTRFSLSKINFQEANEDNIDDNDMIKSDAEEVAPEEYYLKLDIDQKKKSPIIIQAKTYEGSNDVNKDVMINMQENTGKNDEIKTNETGRKTNSKWTLLSNMPFKKLDSVNPGSLSVEASTPNTEIESGSIEQSNTNSELLNTKNLNALQYNASKEISKESSSINTNDNSVDHNVQELDVDSNDDIIQDFLNGSLDVNEYKPEETLPNKNYITKLQQNLEVNTKYNPNIIESPSVESNNISEKHTINRREIPQLHKGHKKQKQTDQKYSNESGYFTEILLQNQNTRKMNGRKIKSTTQSQTRKKTSKAVRKEDESSEDSNLDAEKTPRHKISNIARQANLLKNLSHYKDDTVTNSVHSFDSFRSEIKLNENKKRKNSKNKSKLNKSIKNNTYSMPRRHTRSSSLIASKKIKEIERLENFNEGIYIDSESEIDYTILPKSKIQTKKQTILELEEPSKNRKKNPKEHFLENLTGYMKDNDFKYELNENKDESDENASYFEMNNEECVQRSTKSNKQYKKNLITNTFNTLNAITAKYSTKKNINSINADLEANLSTKDEYILNDIQDNLKTSNDGITGQLKKFESQENKMSDYCNDVSSKYLMTSSNTIKCKQNVFQYRHKTWDDLEQELLSDFNHEIFGSGEKVSKSVTVENKQFIRKQRLSKDKNSLTVSNMSMTQMISKSTGGGKYNMRYEVQNTKSKYTESTPDAHKFQCANSFSKEAIPKSPSMCIIEKAISAMEKCSAGFITKQTNAPQIEWINSALAYADIHRTDNEEEYQLSSTDILYTAKENYQCMSDKKINYMTRARCKRINNNAKQIKNDYDAVLQKHDENESFGDDLLHTMNIRHNRIFKRELNINESNPASQALVVYSGKTNNPWEKLMKKLQVESITHPANRTHEDGYNARKQIKEGRSKNPTRDLKMYCTRSKKLLSPNSEEENENHNVKNTNAENVDDRKYDKSFNGSHENETDLLTQEGKAINLNTALNLDLGDNAPGTENKKGMEVMIISERTEVNARHGENREESNLVSSVGNKRNIQYASTEVKHKKSRKYKINMKDGDLRLKRPSSESSEVSDSLDSMQQKKQKTNETPKFKNNKHVKDKSSKTRTKYNNYLKKIFEKEDSLNKKTVIDDDKIESHSIPKEYDKNSDGILIRNRNAQKSKLIAIDDDDIFSISSSDSDASNMKVPCSGLICDLFDE